MNRNAGHPIIQLILLAFVFLLCHQNEKTEARVSESHLRNRVYRTWSEWSSWSSCSRTCGPGVTMRTRICRIRLNYSPIALSKSCAGENVEHKLCDKQKCPSSDEDFITYQCSLHNGHPVGGKFILEWIPYKQNDNPCELQCQAKDGSRLYSFGKVIDGTECGGSKNPAICVNGRCTQIDCSGQLGTEGQLDMCGVCRGDNSTCVRYQNSYWGRPRSKNTNGGTSAADQHYDYNHIARIPSGVTRILIKESSETNFLALMDKTGQIVINNNWRVTSPGKINTSGTEFTYSRMPTGEDILSAPGPTDGDLFVLVLGSGDIPTVQYEYWYSKKADQKYLDLQKKDQYYVTENKEPPPGVIVSSLRNKNKYTYDGYRSYYRRNEIIPYQSEAKFSEHSSVEPSATAASVVDITPTTAYGTAWSSSTPTVLSRQESTTSLSSTAQHVTTFNPKWIKSRHVIPSPTRDGELDSDRRTLSEISDNRIVPVPSSKSPVTTPSEKSTSRAKDAYVSNAILPPDHRDLLNETRLGWRHQNVLTTPSRATSRYLPLPKSTHIDRGIPTDLKPYHYETGSSPKILSPTQLNAFPDQPCTRRPHIQGFRRQDRKRQKPEIYGDALELYSNKERKEFPGITKFTHTKRKRDHKDKSRAKISHRGSPDIKSKKKKRKRKSNKDQCLPCSRVKNQNKNFCKSDFVLRIIVTSLHEVRGETQFEVQVIQSYKNQIPILPREYLWRLDPCRCPRLHIGREYLVMGYSGASAVRNRESRLYVNGRSFLRRYGRKRASSIQRLARDKDICKKFASSDE